MTSAAFFYTGTLSSCLSENVRWPLSCKCDDSVSAERTHRRDMPFLQLAAPDLVSPPAGCQTCLRLELTREPVCPATLGVRGCSHST